MQSLVNSARGDGVSTGGEEVPLNTAECKTTPLMPVLTQPAGTRWCIVPACLRLPLL